MKLELLTAPYADRVTANALKALDIMRWLAEHPDCHPAERKAQNALLDALEQQDQALVRQWDEARERWIENRLMTRS